MIAFEAGSAIAMRGKKFNRSLIDEKIARRFDALGPPGRSIILSVLGNSADPVVSSKMKDATIVK